MFCMYARGYAKRKTRYGVICQMQKNYVVVCHILHKKTTMTTATATKKLVGKWGTNEAAAAANI